MSEATKLPPTIPTGPLIVHGCAVPLARVIDSDFPGFVSILLRDSIAYDVRKEDFDHLSQLVADAIAIGLGLPCHPRDNGESFEQMRSQIERLHVVLRPVPAVMIDTSTAPEDSSGEKNGLRRVK